MSKLAHIGIVVSDMARSVAFYQDVLSCKVTDARDIGFANLTFLDYEGVPLELVQRKNEAGVIRDGAKGRVDHVGFYVDDIDSEFARLKAKNVPLLTDAPQNNGFMKNFFFFGPDGERLEFVQR